MASPRRKIEATQRRCLEVQVSPKGDTSRHADGEVGHADLELEWARPPSDMGRRCRGKEDISRTGPQTRDADGQQQ